MCFSDKPTLRKQGKGPAKLDFVGQEPPADLDVGWRGWTVERKGSVTLLSPLQGDAWTPGKPMTGKVDPDKKSGVYAFKSIQQLRQYTHVDTESKDVVVGQVVLWGEIAEHVDGYRAERGYPVRVWTNDISLQSEIRDRYKTSVQAGFARSLKAA